MPEIECPRCRWPIPSVPELAGKVVFCQGCGAHFEIPAIGPLQPGESPPKLTFLDRPTPELSRENTPHNKDQSP